jgi:hypothetical protein
MLCSPPPRRLYRHCRVCRRKPTPPPALPTILRLADGVYLPLGATFPFAVTDAEDLVLLAFLRRPAMTLPELVDQSGVAEAGKVLARLVVKYGGSFAAAIRRPGRRGEGGYAVLLADRQPSGIRPATAACRGEE